MKVSVPHSDSVRFRTGGAVVVATAATSTSSVPIPCRYSIMETVESQQHHHSPPSWWNNGGAATARLPSDSSIDSFHPDSSVFSSLNSDISFPSSPSPSTQSMSQLQQQQQPSSPPPPPLSSHHQQMPPPPSSPPQLSLQQQSLGMEFDTPPSPELTPQAEVNPTSFGILASFHGQLQDQRAEYADRAEHVGTPLDQRAEHPDYPHHVHVAAPPEIRKESTKNHFENHHENSAETITAENCGDNPVAMMDSSVQLASMLGASSRPSSSEGPPSRMRLMCSFGGRLMPRPIDGKLRYTGGETRIVAVKRGISFEDFMKKMKKLYGSPLAFKYQLPDEDLDALVSVSSDDDLQNMVEEYEKAESGAAGPSRIRLFFYSFPSDLDISDESLKTDSEGSPSPASDQFAHAVSEKLQNARIEDENSTFKQVDSPNNMESSGRMPSHDVPNGLTHSKSGSTLSSYPSSPPLPPRQVYVKVPEDLGLNDHHFSKLSHRFEGDFEPDILMGSPGSAHYDHQYHYDHHHLDQVRVVATDSPRSVHHEFSAARGEYWHGTQWVESQTRHMHQSALNMDSRITSGGAVNMDSRISSGVPINIDSRISSGVPVTMDSRITSGGAVEYWHDMQQPSDNVSHGEHHRIFQQVHQGLQQQQHQGLQQQQLQGLQGLQQQGWIDGERGDLRTKETYKQPHTFYQPHPPSPSQHYATATSQERGSWSNEHRATPSRFFQASKQSHGQSHGHIPHGLAPAPPYHMDGAPSSPRTTVHDYHGRCSCGLQHSEVHRGITVCIDDQPQNKWPSAHAGDQHSRKHGFSGQPRLYDNRNHFADSSMWQPSSHLVGTTEPDPRDPSRLYDNRNHFVDSSMWQQSSQVIGATEPEHKEYIGKPWQQQQQVHMRHAECQSRSYIVQCHDHLVTDEVYMPSPENYSGKHLVNKSMISHTYHDKPDQHQKQFEVDTASISFSRKAVHKNMTEDYARDERFGEGDSGLYGSNHVQGDWESRRVVPSFTEGMLPYPRRLDGTPVRPLASEELQVNQALPTVATRGSEFQKQLSSQNVSAEVHGLWSPRKPEPLLHVSTVGLSAARGSEFHQNQMSQNVLTEASGFWNTASIDREYRDLSFQHGQHANVRIEGVNDIQLSKEMPRNGRIEGVNDIQSSKEIPRNQPFAPNPLGTNIGNKNISEVDASEAMVVLPQRNDLVDVDPNDTRTTREDAMRHKLPEIIPAFLTMPVEESSAKATDFSFRTSNIMTPALAVVNSTGNEDSTSVGSDSNAKLNIEENKVPDQSIAEPLDVLISQKCEADTESLHVLAGQNCEAADKKNTTNLTEPLKVLASKDEDKKLVPLKVPASQEDKKVAGTALSSMLSSQMQQLEQSSVTIASKVLFSENGVQEEEESGVETTAEKKDVKDENELRSTPCYQSLAEALGLQIIYNADLEDLKELGSGTFGTVFHGKWRGSDVAIKRIKESCFSGSPTERDRLMADFWKEASTLGKLHHPNVVAFYGVVPDGPGGTLATVTEYMVNGSLKQVLQKKDRTIDRRKRLLIAMDAAFGMEYLHAKLIVHFDLKCENLLVNMKDAHRPICKVGDFGLSKVKHQTLVSGGVRGTLPWMAPELLSGNSNKVTEKIDVYSFGIVMWELLTGEEPYANMHCGAIIRGIVDNTLRPSIPSWCDPGWRKLMEQCWSSNPTERPSFTEIALELRALAATMNIK